jgi:RNA polymerase sigma-70 factor (ECF subfamily)
MDHLSNIFKRYLDGDNQSVADLYSKMKYHLLLLSYNYCRDKEICQDIVQDVFEKMLMIPVDKRCEYFGNTTNNIEAYITVIVKNRCLDFYKSKNNREKILKAIRYKLNDVSENKAQERFLKDGLIEMLHRLQPREQEIIRLHLDGYSNEEISVQLHISYNTVKNNIYEAKQKLKKMWDLFMN